MTRRRAVTTGVAAVAATALAGMTGTPAEASQRTARTTNNRNRPTVVLVHGAFADASSWSPVIQRLQWARFPVVAVANPLRGLPADAAHLAARLQSISGPVVLVGHSYGGAVMTEAGASSTGVKALVYVAAFMPDAGEILGNLSAKFPGSELEPTLTAVSSPTPDGSAGLDLYIETESFHQVFADDVPKPTTRMLAAGQRPLSATAFADRATSAAWRTIPSWNLIATKDRAITPDLQRFQARRAGSHTVEVDSSHLPLLSRPDAVADLISAAARGLRD
jgi:pimeloyl-ACP methyl ester carboxylesterase